MTQGNCFAYGRDTNILNKAGSNVFAQDEMLTRYYITTLAEEYAWKGTFFDKRDSAAERFRHRMQGKKVAKQAQPGDVIIATKVAFMFGSAKEAACELAVFGSRGIQVHFTVDQFFIRGEEEDMERLRALRIGGSIKGSNRKDGRKKFGNNRGIVPRGFRMLYGKIAVWDDDLYFMRACYLAYTAMDRKKATLYLKKHRFKDPREKNMGYTPQLVVSLSDQFEDFLELRDMIRQGTVRKVQVPGYLWRAAVSDHVTEQYELNTQSVEKSKRPVMGRWNRWVGAYDIRTAVLHKIHELDREERKKKS